MSWEKTSMTEMSNPNDPAKMRRRYDPRTTLPFLVIVILLYLLFGYIKGSFAMSQRQREMLYVSTPIIAGYYIWIGVRSLFRSPALKDTTEKPSDL